MKTRYLIVLLSGFFISSCGNGVSTSAFTAALSTDSDSIGVTEQNTLVGNNGDNTTQNANEPSDDSEQDSTQNIDIPNRQDSDSEMSDSEPSNSENFVENNTENENTESENSTAASTVTTPDHNFTLSVDNNRRALSEGDSVGTRFTVSAVMDGNQAVDMTVRALSAAVGQRLSVDLLNQRFDAENTNTTVTFSLPVGMRPLLEHERRFEIMASSGDQVRTLELIVDIMPIAVPDIYLLIGQSNMVGRTGDNTKDASTGGSDETHPRIQQLNVSRNDPNLFQSEEDFSNSDNAAIDPRYIRAQDPLHEPLKSNSDSKTGTTIGPGLSFAKLALESTSQNIYLVPAAWESSGFCRSEGADDSFAWNASQTNNTSLGGSGLLERALIRLRITLRDTNGIFRGILWQQGEADSIATACADSYENNLKLMVERIRAEAREDARGESARGPQASIPFIVSTQSRGEDERGDFSRWNDDKQIIDSVHRNIASVVPFSDWVNNDDLLPPSYPCGSTGCIHFGPLASREIGRRFFEAMERVWQSADP